MSLNETAGAMKRYRVLSFDFDSRANILAQEPALDWSPEAKEMNETSKRGIIEGLASQFGPMYLDQKVEDFKAIKALPISLVTFHNRLFRQARAAFVCGYYYPALTSVCALGERILNHLILSLRDYYRTTPEYKKVYRKNSFDNWKEAIDTLVAWGVLLPKATEAFRELNEYRNRAIHFNPETEANDRALALEAILKFNEIVIEQFSGFGTQPWYIEGTLGAIFVKKSYEEFPFTKEIVLPNCHNVGHLHLLHMQAAGWIVKDDHTYGDKSISDEEFKDLYNNRKL